MVEGRELTKAGTYQHILRCLKGEGGCWGVEREISKKSWHNEQSNEKLYGKVMRDGTMGFGGLIHTNAFKFLKCVGMCPL